MMKLRDKYRREDREVSIYIIKRMQQLSMNCNAHQLASMPLNEKKHFAEIIASIKD
jgi:hypothetical protein